MRWLGEPGSEPGVDVEDEGGEDSGVRSGESGRDSDVVGVADGVGLGGGRLSGDRAECSIGEGRSERAGEKLRAMCEGDECPPDAETARSFPRTAAAVLRLVQERERDA